ncbi:winged helix-turn-helix domain-containing protein [Acidicapsa dinghuensis]|uniref:Winged helix-turn-helix domain-containing protein n=1 Tax=Acidicapsa dinghuensis TaxID=2218256 RepID=A0ABW1EG72_9BACT|nr:winged helix-turn-helix domain-containing protein [Acidicapsa dinghuensis]
MTISHTESLIRFGLFELDLRSSQLTKNGMKIRLPQQPIQVLSLLLERAGEIVTREELRQRLWSSDVFVDFDHGLNKSVQKLRDALGDSAASPRYIETIPRVGYRFIAPVHAAEDIRNPVADTTSEQAQDLPASLPNPAAEEPRQSRWLLFTVCAGGVVICAILAIAAIALWPRLHSPEIQYTQLTDFTDSAIAPALSPDGRMVAFIRGGNGFLSTDQIYVKMLPAGEARRVTDDSRPKYGLAFSPDGSEIAYTVLEGSTFSTVEVSTLGGEPHLLLDNAAGLVWLDQQRLLFSEIRSGIHMGVVTATVTRSGLREIYFPAHERGMAHYSFPSPDRRRALVVEMNGNGEWAQCKLVDLEAQSPPVPVGPAGSCSAAGWSPDGNWMYFTASLQGQSHIWRQRFPQGDPEQVTFGPTEENGIAVEPAGRALITSAGVHESSIWIHDKTGERPLSSEGEIEGRLSPPVFNQDASVLYYLLRRRGNSNAELWRTVVESGQSEAVFSGVAMTAFDLSSDGKQVVYTTAVPGQPSQLWLAPLDRSLPVTRVDISGVRSPHFGIKGQILFQYAEGNKNYIGQIDPDGSHRSRAFAYPILGLQGISPNREWAVVSLPDVPGGSGPEVAAIPLNGGKPHRLCVDYCVPRWSTDGRFLFVPVDEPSLTSPGRSLAIPVGPAEELSDIPSTGIPPLAGPGVIKGATSVNRAILVPGRDPERYAWVNTVVHRNLYRISLP